MAPEYVSDNDDEPIVIHGQSIKKKKGKVGIYLLLDAYPGFLNQWQLLF